MHKKLITACLALVAFAAFVLPATASASPLLTYPTGTADPVGSLLRATNEGETLMTDAFGGVTVRCNHAELTGEVTKNNGTEIEGDITTADFTGTGAEGRCTSTFGGDTRVTTSVTSGLPYCIRATAAMNADELQVRGGKCSEAARAIRFVFDTTNLGECAYERTAAIPGTYTTHPTAAQASISKVKFTRTSGSALCPAEGFLDMKFNLFDDPSGNPVYID